MERSTALANVDFLFNTRPTKVKQAFFEAVADEVTALDDLMREDLLMVIAEVRPKTMLPGGRSIQIPASILA